MRLYRKFYRNLQLELTNHAKHYAPQKKICRTSVLNQLKKTVKETLLKLDLEPKGQGHS